MTSDGNGGRGEVSSLAAPDRLIQVSFITYHDLRLGASASLPGALVKVERTRI
jgi:hypothetical protein